jgi:hypothetical protein
MRAWHCANGYYPDMKLRKPIRSALMKLLAAFLSIIAILGAAATFDAEYRVSDLARADAATAFLALTDGIPPYPYSARGMREVMMTCAAVQQGAIYALQPPPMQARVDASCRAFATAVLVRNPTYGAAHTIVMLSSKGPDAGVRSLIRSQQTAPLEAWHAKLRLRQGLQYHADGVALADGALADGALADGALADGAMAADVGFLLQSSDGRKWLARLYTASPALRDDLAGLITPHPKAAQAAFLHEVRALGKN